jgi:hypothetical protein
MDVSVRKGTGPDCQAQRYRAAVEAFSGLCGKEEDTRGCLRVLAEARAGSGRA